MIVEATPQDNPRTPAGEALEEMTMQDLPPSIRTMLKKSVQALETKEYTPLVLSEKQDGNTKTAKTLLIRWYENGKFRNELERIGEAEGRTRCEGLGKAR